MDIVVYEEINQPIAHYRFTQVKRRTKTTQTRSLVVTVGDVSGYNTQTS